MYKLPISHPAPPTICDATSWVIRRCQNYKREAASRLGVERSADLHMCVGDVLLILPYDRLAGGIY